MPFSRFLSIFLLAAGALISGLQAADNVWVGNDNQSNGAWSRTGNWTNNTSPNFQTNNRIVFATNSASTNMLYDLGGWISSSDIIWDTSFNVSRTLTSTGGGIDFATRLENLSSFTQTVSMNLSGGKFGAGDIQLNPVNGDLVINGTIFNDRSLGYSIWGNAGRTLTLNGTLGPNATQSAVFFTMQRGTTVVLNTNQLWQGTTTLNGGTLHVGASGLLGDGNYSGAVALNSYNGTNSSLIFSNSRSQTMSGAISGSGTLIQSGIGTTTLRGNNTYTGGTFVNGGTLALSNNNVNVLSGPITVNSGATLRAQGVNIISDTSAMTLNGGTYAMGTNGDYIGSLTMNGNSTVSGTSGAGGAQFILTAGQATNSTIKTLTATGTNNLIQANIGISSQWGGVGGNANLNFNVTNAADSLTVSGVIADKAFDGGGNATSGAITKSGQGTLILTGDNTYTGGASILAGTVQVGNGGTTGNITGNAAAILNNGTLIINRADGFGLDNAISGTGRVMQSGSGTTTVTGVNTYSGGTVVNGGTLQVGNGGTSGSLGSGAVSNNSSLVFNRSDAVTVGNTISGSGIVTLSSGAGALTLTGSNSYSGGTVVSSTAGLNVAGGTNLGTGTLTFSRQGSTLNMTAANGVFNNAIVLASGSGTTSLRAQQNVSTNTFNGTISGGSSNSVLYIEGGAGGNNSAFTVLNGTNSFLGTINVFRSPLVLGNASAAGQASILLNANNNAAGDLQFGSGGFSISNNVQLGNSGTANLIGVASGQGNGISGVLSGNGLNKVGGGTLTLAGNNTYSGDTAISGGTLQVGNGGTTGTMGSGNVTNNATLAINRSDAVMVGNTISGTGSLTQVGSGTTSVTGNNSYSGGTTISGGTLQVGNGGTSGSIGSGNVVNNSSLVLNRSDAATVGNAISGSGAVTQAGSGTTTFTGINTYTGLTTVNAGTLILNAGAFGTGILPGNAVVNNGGTLQINQGSSRFPVMNTNIVTVNGGGNLVFTGSGANQDAMAYLGTVTLSNSGGLGAMATTPDGSGIRFGNSGRSGTVNSFGSSTNTFGANIFLVNNSSQGTGTMTFNSGASNTLLISGVIADYTASGGLTGTPVVFSGSGTMLLSGTNTYTGGTTVTAGRLVISGLLGGGSYSSAIVNNASLVFSNSANQTLNGVVSGSGTLTKAGPGTVTLSQANSYTGGTMVSQGALVGGASSSFGSGAIVLGDGNTGANNIVLMADTTADTTITNAITVANLGTGLVSIGGTNTGVSSVNAWTGTLTLNRNVQVFNDTPHAGGRTSFLGQITGSGGITVTQGRGRVTLQNTNNNFTGPVVVDSGATLQLAVANGINEVIPDSAAVTVNGSLNFASGGGNETIGSLSGAGTISSVVAGNYSLVVGNSNSTTFSGVINNGSGVLGLSKGGSSTLTLAGANTYSGGTTISGGTLQVGNGGTSGTLGSGNVTNNSALVFNRSDAAMVGNAISGSGAVTQAGTGTTTLSGNNTYTGATTISGGGALALSSRGTISSSTNINLGTTNSRGTLDVSAKGESGHTFGTGQTLSGNGTITTGATNRTIIVNGTLNPGNSIGTVAVIGNLTLGSTAQSIFELGTAGTFASPGQSDRTTVTGNLTLGGSLSLLDNANQNGQGVMGPGVYRLFTYGGSLSGSFTNTPPSLIYNSALYRPSLVTATLGVVDLNIAQLASGSFFTNAISMAYHVTNSGSVSTTLGISNTVAAGGGSLGVSLVSNSGTASITGGTNFSNLAPGASTNLTISVAKTSAGTTTGTALFAMNDTGVGGGSAPVSLGSNSIAYTATGYNLASAALASTNINLGRIHSGGTFGTTNLSLGNSAIVSAFTETLAATLGSATGGVSGSGSVTGLAAGSSDTGLSVTLTNNTAGAKSGTISVALTSQEVGNSGLGNTSLGSQTVNVTGFVYTGQGVWNTIGGSWSDFGNWQQAGGVAGIDGVLSANDTATFGAGGSGSVTLDGAAPSLQSITFSNSTSSYEIAQGSGGGLTLQSGNTNASLNVQAGGHSITASVNAASDITVNTASNSRLTLGGSVSGVGGLNQTGSGTTILTASNSYTGLTKVSGGTLAVNGSIAGNLQVDAGATLKGSGTIAGDATISGTHSPGNSPGIQTFGGNLTYQPGSSMVWQLASNTTTNSSLAYDQVMVGGNLAFNGGTTLQLVFNDLGSVVNWTDALWSSNQSWTIYQVSGLTSGFENLTIASYSSLLDAYGNVFGTTLAGASFSIGQNGENVTLTYTVPEPSTYALIGLGGLAMVVAYRRRR